MNTVARLARLLAAAMLLAACVLAPAPARAAFGLTSDATYYTVDTGAGLVFKVRRTDNGSSTQSAGDIASLIYNGTQYQDTARGSQVNSGFDFLYNGVSAVSVTASVFSTSYINVTVQAGNLTHYYLVHNGEPCIYMGTYFTTEPDTLGLCRYIVRIPSKVLPNGPVPSDIRGNTGAIESADIFGLSSGQTRSKHYSNMRLRDWAYIGATGTNVGVWMVRDNNEGNSGGPFFRCLLNQGTDTDQEITYIVNYGEGQTEAFRTGILNTYALVFTNGAAPTLPFDTRPSWFSGMGLTGYVPDTGRGSVTGTGITGRDANYLYTIGMANSAAQYWTTASATDGSFNCTGMLPGTYAMTVYKNELAVYTGSVSVTAGNATALSAVATDDPSSNTAVWRIGDWDGTPHEFLNGDKVTTMHPSDVRMASWTPGTYVVGTSNAATGFPCYQWKDINSGQAVQFNLTAKPSTALTARIGITTAYAGARPKITVNSWTSANPTASTQPNTRTLTVGTYRGNNTTYTFSVPASAFVVGTNTLTIYPISGSGSTRFLSAGYSLDCVDLVDLTAPPPAAMTTISGTAALQGLASGSWAQPLTFTLTPTGRTAGSQVIQNLTPVADGSFSLSNVPAGTYTLGIKGARWLRKNTAVNTASGNVSGLSVSLLTGDVNGDNIVNADDGNALSAAYGSAPGQPAWNSNADLNGDGVINITDINILFSNFRKFGDP